VTMADGHPYEHDLLAYVEDELPRGECDAVALHLKTCAECRQLVTDAQAGRALVRAAPPLELSDARRKAIAASLGPAANRRRRPSWRLVAILAATLALGTLLGIALVNSGGGQDDSGGSEAAGAMTDATAEDSSGGTAAPRPEFTDRTLLAQVAGPPAEVVQTLRSRGAEARIEDGVVVVNVEGMTPKEIDDLVAGLEPGPVQIYGEGS
jgi:Putative zinc-finger